MTQQPTHGDVPAWTLGDRLGKALEHSGVKHAEMATYLEVSRNTIGNYIADRTKVPASTILAWSLRTGVPVGWLKTGTHTAPTDPGRGAGTTTEKLARLTERKIQRSKRGETSTHEYLAVA